MHPGLRSIQDQVLDSVKIIAKDYNYIVIIKAQDEDIRACRMMSVPPKVFKVVKDKEEGGVKVI